jgi:predicted DNA-binding antitoxin AbrB/MazE fold protein
MNTTFTAIYEKGLLRPLRPLALPEHARVQIRIIKSPTDAKKSNTDRLRVYEALMDAGLIRQQPAVEFISPVAEAELSAAAAELAKAGPISELIIAERAESDY